MSAQTGKCIRSELLDFLDLAREFIGECVFKGLDKANPTSVTANNGHRIDTGVSAHLSLSGRIATKAVESNGVHRRLYGEGGTKSGGSES